MDFRTANSTARKLNSRIATASRCWSRRARITFLITPNIITAKIRTRGVTKQIDSAAKKTFAALRSEHVADFQALFNRVSADFGQSSGVQTSLPTDQRKLEAFKTVDPGLEALLFQYGRYLLISCSRPGGLPANLQGLWNDNNSPPWHSDYHANINIQMNYWPAEVANLGECHTPLFDLIGSQLPAWREATAKAAEFKTADGNFTKRGFAIRTSHNIIGGMGWKWDKTANAWYCQHFWEHYAFGQDKNYLRTVAYPIMKETCEFWEDHLKALPDGRLVVPNGWSPEHGPDEDGVSYNQEIVWDLFNNFVSAADALGADKDYRDKIAAMRDKLVTPQIGKWGQLSKDDEDDRPRRSQRPPPPHVAFVRGLSRHANWREQNAGAGEGGEGFARRARHRAGQRRARMVVRVAHGALCAVARCRTSAPDVAAIIFFAEHLPEPVRPASTNAD